MYLISYLCGKDEMKIWNESCISQTSFGIFITVRSQALGLSLIM